MSCPYVSRQTIKPSGLMSSEEYAILCRSQQNPGFRLEKSFAIVNHVRSSRTVEGSFEHSRDYCYGNKYTECPFYPKNTQQNIAISQVAVGLNCCSQMPAQFSYCGICGRRIR